MSDFKDSNKTVLVIGATGALGGLVARAVQERGARLRLLVREASRHKLAPELGGAELVEDDPAIFTGVDTVISVVQGGAGTMIDAQLRWLEAARAAGVRRFIPSDFSMNLYGLADGDNHHSDLRREFARRSIEVRGDVEIVHILNGAFINVDVLYGFLGAFDLDRNEANLWGEGEQLMDFTTFEDTAQYTAEVALDDRSVPEKFYIAGEVLNFNQMVYETETGLGRRLTINRKGSLTDLDRAVAEAGAHNPMAAVPLMYWRAMLSGKGKAPRVMNDRYPHVRPTSMREYVRAHLRETSREG